MKRLTARERAIVAGLYLSKFDVEGLGCLGFDSFVQAFNVIGLALGVQPASVKNYRDEFDPLFPNDRRGWHGRAMRKYCRDIYDAFGALGLADFSLFLRSLIYRHHDLDVLAEQISASQGEPTGGSFAKRLITGQAAEQYFRDNFRDVEFFTGYVLEDTTAAGCGFDFRLVPEKAEQYCAVEVKGLNSTTGSIALTDKEHAVAGVLRDRYYLFVVKNFRERPFHRIYQDPIESLSFSRVETQIVQVTWNSVV